MPAEDGAEFQAAFSTFQEERKTGRAHRSDAALERALLSTSAASVDADNETVASAVRQLRAADDNGTTRIEVRDQAMTHRRWFEVDADGALTWGER